MFIKNLHIQNFKSFETLELQLNPLNVLIGTNASGKSNFIAVFKFIRDIFRHGVNNAISMQSGIAYLRNVNLGYTLPTSVEMSIGRTQQKSLCETVADGIRHRLTLEHIKRGQGFKVSQNGLISAPIQSIFANLPIYDFNPQFVRHTIPLPGKVELEEDGSNLLSVLRRILDSKERRRKFSNLLNYLLPFVGRVAAQKFADQFLTLCIEETYTTDKVLPVTLISDGTIRIIALIIALYFEEQSVVVFEDIERGIHPSLMSKVIDLMMEVSSDKQIFVTTHNPQVLKHAPYDSILLVSRDARGFSTITRPLEKDTIQTFLKHDLSVDDLYIQNMLELS